jgi:hypothetical protein
LTFARTDWERPNFTQTASWTTHALNNAHQRGDLHVLARRRVHQRVHGTGEYQRSRYNINYPYIFQEKEIFDKVPTISISASSDIDGGPYPAFSSGPIHTVSNTTTWVRGRHTLKGGVMLEYSGQDDFDQINVSAIPGGTNNQNGRFEFRRRARRRLDGAGGRQHGARPLHELRRARAAQLHKWRALATDLFLQDSWKPTSAITVEGGFRWVFWPPWYSTTNNIANFDPRFYDPAQAAVINPTTGRLVGGSRYNGIVLPGSGFLDDAQNSVSRRTRPCRRSSATSRAASRRRTTTHRAAPRHVLLRVTPKTMLRTSAGVFHNRVTLNDSTLLGGNPPFQPMVTWPAGAWTTPGGGGTGVTDLPFGMQAQDVVFKHPTSYMWSGGVQREVPFGFVVDRPTSAAAASTCRASATSTSCCRARCRPTRASTSRRCVRTRATTPSGSRRTRAARSTTACS